MDRRQALGFAGATLLVGIGFGLGGAALAQDKLVLKATDVHPFGYPTVEAVMWMGEELEKRPTAASASRCTPRCSSAARRR